jgi:putative salt-induced outer membrane protein
MLMKQVRYLMTGVGLVALAIMGPSRSFAEEPGLWKGNLELSYLQTGGNTDSKTFAAGGKAERALQNAKLTGQFNAIYGEHDGVASDKNWMGGLKYDRYVSSRAFAYLGEQVERDVLKGVEIRYTTQAGMGYEFIKTESDLLKGEFGVGYVRENPIAVAPFNSTDPLPGEPLHDLGYPNARAYGEYGHAFDEKTRFLQTVGYLPGLKGGVGFLAKEESSFIANIMGNFAWKISYAVTYDSDPQSGFDKYDRLFKTSLLYTF